MFERLSRAKILNGSRFKLLILGFVISSLLFSPDALSHDTKHKYTLQTNGTIIIGREEEAGGCIVWISDVNDPERNFVNNYGSVNGDIGRQVQFACRDDIHPNPTQGGDRLSNLPGCEVFHVGDNYIFSESIPLHYNPPDFQKTYVHGQRYYMWTEFLPDSNGRAFFVRGYWTNEDPWEGKSYGQEGCVRTIGHFNWTDSERLASYIGHAPWTGDSDLIFLAAPEDLLFGKSAFQAYCCTENWSALVDENDYGLAMMNTSGYGRMGYSKSKAGTGDHQPWTKVLKHLERFCMRVDPGMDKQTREHTTLFYLGDFNDARSFFEKYRPHLSADFNDAFDSNDLLDWYRNSYPIEAMEECPGGPDAVKMGTVDPGVEKNWWQELALRDKVWGDAVYSVNFKIDPQSPNKEHGKEFGLVIRKTGENHFYDYAKGYGGISGNYWIVLKDTNTANAKLEFRVRPTNEILGWINLHNFDETQWHTLEVTATGYHFEVEIDDGAYSMTVNDGQERWGYGYVSLAADWETVVWFDDFQVDVDSQFVPLIVSDFSVTANGKGDELELTWTNPTNPSWRWMRIVRREGDIGGAPNFPTYHFDVEGFPAYQGKMSAYTDAGLDPDKMYYYAAYAVDDAGNYFGPVYARCRPVGAPIPDFCADPTYGLTPLTTKFTDQSANNPTAWEWDFESDGIFDDNIQDPFHTFSKRGFYTVKLKATNSAAQHDAKTELEYIEARDELAVHIASQEFDNQQGLNNWWYYEDQGGGNYVQLTWNNQELCWEGTDQANTRIYSDTQSPGLYDSVRVWECPTPPYGADVQSIVIGGYVQLVEQGGDGIFARIHHSDDLINPIWERSIASTDKKNKRFLIKKELPIQTGEKIYFSLNQKGNPDKDLAEFNPIITHKWHGDVPDPYFTAEKTTGLCPLVVNFTNLTIGSHTCIEWNWDFDDGSDNSTERHPSHTFTYPGLYVVRLTASNIYGPGVGDHTVVINVLNNH